MFVKHNPLDLVIHENHPVSGIHPEVRLRLINAFTNDRCRFSRVALMNMAEAHPLSVFGKGKKMRVISGWLLHAALQLYKCDVPVTYLIRNNLSPDQLKRIFYGDFFFFSALPASDEIAHRIYAILMDQIFSDTELRTCLHVDSPDSRKFFNLRIRKRDTLTRRLEREAPAVQRLIGLAPKPLGAGQSEQNISLQDGNSGKTEQMNKNEGEAALEDTQNSKKKTPDTFPQGDFFGG